MPTKNTRVAAQTPEAGVRLQVASRSRRIPPAAKFRAWVRAAANGPMDVTIRLVSATEGRRLNLTYRGMDHATNVLTFTYETSRGDIVLCPTVIAREAREQGKSSEAHYAHLTVHAVLHMRGYDHVRRSDAKRMESAEKRILWRLGLPDPYAA